MASIGYILLVSFARCFIFLLGPNLLFNSVITNLQFILAIIIPFPFLIYWIVLIVKKKDRITIDKSVFQLRFNTANVLEKICYSTLLVKDSSNISWLGVTEFYRLIFLIFDIFFQDTIARFFAITVVSLLFGIMVVSFRPYKHICINLLSILCQFSLFLVGMTSFNISSLIHYKHSLSVIGLLYAEKLFTFVIPLSLCLILGLPFIRK